MLRRHCPKEAFRHDLHLAKLGDCRRGSNTRGFHRHLHRAWNGRAIRTASALDGPASARPWVRYGGWPTRDTSKFNSLAAMVSPPVPGGPRKIPTPLKGDPAAGQKLVADRSRGGSCIACHVMGPAGGADLPGNVGPDLPKIGNAGRDDEWLFNYVNHARVYNPDTVMPPWGTHGIFTDAEIGDIVAFLKTLTRPAPSSPHWTTRAGARLRSNSAIIWRR